MSGQRALELGRIARDDLHYNNASSGVGIDPGADGERDEEVSETAPILGDEDDVSMLVRRAPMSRLGSAVYCVAFLLLVALTVAVALVIVGLARDPFQEPHGTLSFVRTHCNTVRPSPRVSPLRHDWWERRLDALVSGQVPIWPRPEKVHVAEPCEPRPFDPSFWIDTPTGNVHLRTVAERFCATVLGMHPQIWNATVASATGDSELPSPNSTAPLRGVRLVALESTTLQAPRAHIDESYSIFAGGNESVIHIRANTGVGAHW